MITQLTSLFKGESKCIRNQFFAFITVLTCVILGVVGAGKGIRTPEGLRAHPLALRHRMSPHLPRQVLILSVAPPRRVVLPL